MCKEFKINERLNRSYVKATNAQYKTKTITLRFKHQKHIEMIYHFEVNINILKKATLDQWKYTVKNVDIA